MKLTIQRLIAILLLTIPGIIACFGFLKMKDAIFLYWSTFGDDSIESKFEWGKFLLGLIMFGGGAGFIGGWTFYRDRKRNYVAPRFKEKRNRPPKPTRSKPSDNKDEKFTTD